MGLTELLGSGPIAIDTAPFIYWIEENPKFLARVEPIFAGVDSGRWAAVTSTLTLLETLVVPLRAGDVALAARYEAVLSRGRGLQLVDIDRPILRAAALLRARHSIKTPDAIQVATALATGCTALVTNDGRLPVIKELRVVTVEELGD